MDVAGKTMIDFKAKEKKKKSSEMDMIEKDLWFDLQKGSKFFIFEFLFLSENSF